MMAAVGLALAVTALALGTFPVVSVFALIPASVAFVFSLLALMQARRTNQGKWIAIQGVVLAVAAVCWVPVASTVIPAMLGALLPTIQRSDRGAERLSTAAPVADPIVPKPATALEAAERRYAGIRRHEAAPTAPTPLVASPQPALQDRQAIEAKLNALDQRWAATPPEDWHAQVRSLREEINSLQKPDDATSLHEHLDDIVLRTLDALAAARLTVATNAHRAGGNQQALRAIDAFLDDEVARVKLETYAAPATPALAALATLRQQIVVSEDPIQRFTPRGAMGGARGTRVTVHDNITGDNAVIVEGDMLAGGYAVTAIRETEREIRLNKNGREYVLRW